MSERETDVESEAAIEVVDEVAETTAVAEVPETEAEVPQVDDVAETEPGFAPLEAAAEPEAAAPAVMPTFEQLAAEIDGQFAGVAAGLGDGGVAVPGKAKRRFPWRWAAAVVTALAVGTGCAFAVMAPKRTDLPGLQTAPDGRYDFATLTLPTLAPGQVDPTSTANSGSQHLSDIRKLLLSPPAGATRDYSLPGTAGWVSRADTVTLFGGGDAAKQLEADGWRHTAGIAWKTPDGAETKIWLVQFIDNTAESDATTALTNFDGGTAMSADGNDIKSFEVNSTAEVTYSRVVKGGTATWYGQLALGDIAFEIVFTAPTSVGLAPFQQEASLQTELLE
ncbi:hypothetical protein KDK95_10940 [Actinospica sp. MGRD01-02]|uniref:Uncharacterized protein n=1 Tax=Actinospica acidithermotolerans TaxID=2828514 RepID=A0A941EAB3_9ACTN|nr:hypothetical protein [Actinospica acidithermotolerans]MBR7826818.1 hypothetical protein [Actinospica acidithermotolerans]